MSPDRVDEAILGLFVKGVNMEQVGNMVKTLTGNYPYPSTVLLVFHTLEEELERWKKRSLKARYLYALKDTGG